MVGLSPSLVPDGPNATAFTGVSDCTDGCVADGLADGVEAGLEAALVADGTGLGGTLRWVDTGFAAAASCG
jgi:hypothetical protein